MIAQSRAVGSALFFMVVISPVFSQITSYRVAQMYTSASTRAIGGLTQSIYVNPLAGWLPTPIHLPSGAQSESGVGTGIIHSAPGELLHRSLPNGQRTGPTRLRAGVQASSECSPGEHQPFWG